MPYDDAPWSDCDPFELIRYRVIHLVHGGHQVRDNDLGLDSRERARPYWLLPFLSSITRICLKLQCQESKNITKHCIPDELTPGTEIYTIKNFLYFDLLMYRQTYRDV